MVRRCAVSSSKRRSHGLSIPTSQQKKIIVGLDFGTTYSGMCWVRSGARIDDIGVVSNWPGRSETVYKIPSRMAYMSENPNMRSNQFGYLVKPSTKQVAWFKLRLDRGAAPTVFDDPHLQSFKDSGIGRLPENLSAKQVTTDFLKQLHMWLMQQLGGCIDRHELNETPIEVWLTVPASWSDLAKADTREAAIQAGFGERVIDSVKIVTEPECAGIFALSSEFNRNASLVNAGESFVICDCGGGTVDLTAYTLKTPPPKPEFQEICKGKAGKCGATMIDRAFCSWMERAFGEAYNSLPEAQRGPGSMFMREFEDHKATFGSMSSTYFLEDGYLEVKPIKMKERKSAKYDPKAETVFLPITAPKEFFDATIEHIIQLLSEQIKEAKAQLSGKGIDRVILVGGLGNNFYVRNKLKEWCARQTPAIDLMSPPHGKSQACIMIGAAIRGLLGMKPTYRVSRRHYGFGISLPFREGIDPPKEAWFDDEGDKFCYKRLLWIVHKGQFLENDFKEKVGLRMHFTRAMKKQESIEFFSCEADEAPDYDDDPRVCKVATVTYDFFRSDFKGIKQTYSKALGENRQVLKYFAHANMSADEGVLAFDVEGERLLASTNVVFHEM